MTLIRLNTKEPPTKGAVLVQNGYGTDSVTWVDKGNESLAFMLAEAGYDVWLGNSRGTRLSLGHKNLSTKDQGYWDYSFHEIAIYDIPVFIDRIRKVTRADKITFVGYSTSATSALVYASLLKDHAKKNVNLFITAVAYSYLKYPRFPVIIFFLIEPGLKALVAIIGDENFKKILRFAIRSTMRYAPFLLLLFFEAFEPTPKQKYPVSIL